jgi:phosphatidylglycerol---prolipoprotein diacylglyceryl transferase
MIPYFSFTTIEFGFVTLQVWGLFFALAIGITFSLILKEAKLKNIKKDLTYDLLLWILLGIFGGMRFFYVIQYPYYFSHPQQIFNIMAGGYASWGGILGGLGTTFIFLKIRKIDKKTTKQLADIIAKYLPIGIIVGRLGCFMTKDHLGAITALPWGIIWPDGSSRHPVALYLMLNGFLIFTLLKIIKKHVSEGQLFYYFLGFYSLARFLFDFTRTTIETGADPHIFGLGVSQWVYLGIFLLTQTWILIENKKTK